VWHASVANLKVALTNRWGEGTLRDARRRAMTALEGVGRGEAVLFVGEMALHLRRSLFDEEVGMLSAEWLAIPARNEFSADGQVEMRL